MKGCPPHAAITWLEAGAMYPCRTSELVGYFVSSSGCVPEDWWISIGKSKRRSTAHYLSLWDTPTANKKKVEGLATLSAPNRRIMYMYHVPPPRLELDH